MKSTGRLDSLGRLDDLTPEYRDALTHRNLVPLWPSLRSVLPPHIPTRKTAPTHWSFSGLRSLLLKAGEVTPIEKAERRVLVLANPGHGLEKMQASSAIYLGMQLLLPGEVAPAHRHTPNAVRLMVEGSGAWTLVNGEKCFMERGDLILTPTGLRHEHGHEGTEPVIWLDVLDLPLVHYLETSYHEETPSQHIKPGDSAKVYARGGMVPAPAFARASTPYPMLRYPWSQARAALSALAEDRSDLDFLQIQYVNPENGQDPESILAFYALMLRPGQSLRLPARSPAQVFHVIEGAAEARIADRIFSMALSDTCVSPGYTSVTLSNGSQSQPCFIFIADESPLHRKLGVYEVRG